MSDEAGVSPPGRVKLSQSLAWYRAFTLTERRELMRDRMPSTGEGHAVRSLSGQATNRGRSQYPFDMDANFRQRLASLSMSESEFETLMSLPVEALGENVRRQPAWLQKLCEVFFRPHTLADRQPGGFLQVIGPLLDHCASRLREGVLKIQAVAWKSLHSIRAR